MDATTTHLLEKARDTLLSAQKAMPAANDVDGLKDKLQPALERGYFTPEEDAEIKQLFANYLHLRGALHQTLTSLKPLVPRFTLKSDPDTYQVFVAAWLSGCILMRTARYMVTEFYKVKPVRKLLNQADPVYGIPLGIFDAIHKGSTVPSTLLRYLRAARLAESRKEELNFFEKDPLTGPLLLCLKEEQPFIENQKRTHAKAYARCQWFRMRSRPSKQYRAVLWGLFEASGRAIAEVRNPLHRKRVSKKVLQEVAKVMQPGDVLITRHDDAMSNLFLPGFWPHAAFVIGTEDQRQKLGIDSNLNASSSQAEDPLCIVEAKKDGVLFRSLEETLYVDAFTLFRPNFQSTEDQKQAVERAISHEGKLYDFEFDFTRADKLVCTEVVYRALDGLGGLHFELIRTAGRFTLPAEELMKQGLKKKSLGIRLCFGLKGNHLLSEDRALNLVSRSLNI